MKKISHYMLACCFAVLGFMPSSAFANYALSMANSFEGTLRANSTYYFNSGNTAQPFSSSEMSTRLIVPKDGTLTAVHGNIFTKTPADIQACTISIIINGNPTQLTTFLIVNPGSNPFSDSSLNISLTAGDVLQMQLETPNWTRIPYKPTFSLSLFIEEPV